MGAAGVESSAAATLPRASGSLAASADERIGIEKFEFRGVVICAGGKRDVAGSCPVRNGAGLGFGGEPVSGFTG